MKVINWITYLFYRLFLKCGKNDLDAKYTAKLFTGVFVNLILIGFLCLIICYGHHEYLDIYIIPFNGIILALLVLIFLLWYYWNKWEIRMRTINATYNSWSKKKQKWMLAVPILADIASFAFVLIAYNIVKYYF